jgi:ribosomal protein S18 acetylase RimI-like enzyme
MMAASDPWRRFKYSETECYAKLTVPELRVDVADSDGEVIGFLASMEHGVSMAPLMEYLCVTSTRRDLGVGTSLVAFFEHELFPEAPNLFLFVSDINPSAARLYTRLGYLPVGALPDYNYESQTEFMFRKTRRPKRQHE